MISPIFLNKSEKSDPVSLSPIYFIKSPFLIIKCSCFSIYRVGLNYFFYLQLLMNPLARLQELAGNYISLFTFSIVKLITNKSPKDLSGKPESCHAFAKGTG